MALIGMPYQGSKGTIAKEIIDILPCGNRFVDLFGGGGAMTETAVRSNKYNQVLYNELDYNVYKLFKDSINGKYNYKNFKPEWVTREQFAELKKTDGYISLCWSFGNGQRQYLYGADIENNKRSLHEFVVNKIKDDFINSIAGLVEACPDSVENISKRRKLTTAFMKRINKRTDLQHLEHLERLQHLERLELTNNTYLNYQHKDGDVVYCDPPYESTTGYRSLQELEFGSKEFYNWVASREYPVFFSSYEISDTRFTCIHEIKKIALMAPGGTVTQYKIEKVYCNDIALEKYGYKKYTKTKQITLENLL